MKNEFHAPRVIPKKQESGNEQERRAGTAEEGNPIQITMFRPVNCTLQIAGAVRINEERDGKKIGDMKQERNGKQNHQSGSMRERKTSLGFIRNRLGKFNQKPEK